MVAPAPKRSPVAIAIPIRMAPITIASTTIASSSIGSCMAVRV
jgi:hypothetical protein